MVPHGGQLPQAHRGLRPGARAVSRLSGRQFLEGLIVRSWPRLCCADRLMAARQHTPAASCLPTWLLLLPRVLCCRYQSIVAAHPGNVEALRYLVALCQQSGRAADAQRYGHLLRRAEVSRHAVTGFATAENTAALRKQLVAHAGLRANLTTPSLQLPAGTHYHDAGDRGGSCSCSGRASAAATWRRPAAARRHWL